MKYTFMTESGQQKTVNIDDAWIAKQCQLLKLSKREAIEMWLSDEGYISNDVVTELTAAAKANGAGVTGVSTKPRKKPERKPDLIKREIINQLSVFLQNHSSDFDLNNCITNVDITNIERVVSFTVGDDKYELTLSKKRKPKN